MKDISLKIKISDFLYDHEFDFAYGNKSNNKVTFVYVNIKTGKETKKYFTYKEALELAYKRSSDGRYKNFVYEIEQ